MAGNPPRWAVSPPVSVWISRQPGPWREPFWRKQRVGRYSVLAYRGAGEALSAAAAAERAGGFRRQGAGAGGYSGWNLISDMACGGRGAYYIPVSRPLLGWSSVCAFAPMAWMGGGLSGRKWPQGSLSGLTARNRRIYGRHIRSARDVYILFVLECEIWLSPAVAVRRGAYIFCGAVRRMKDFILRALRRILCISMTLRRRAHTVLSVSLALSKEHIKRLAEWVKRAVP